MEHRIYSLGGSPEDGFAELVDLMLNSLGSAVTKVSEDELRHSFQTSARKAKSISHAIQLELGSCLINGGWEQNATFLEPDRFKGGHGQFDFAQQRFGVLFAFHNRGSIISNLMRPSVARFSETNRQRWIGGALITASESLKRNGGFDGAIGTSSDYVEYAAVLSRAFAMPTYLVELGSPTGFQVVPNEWFPGRRRGVIQDKDETSG